MTKPTYRETLGALITIRGLIDRELTRVQCSAPAELTPSVQLQLQNLVNAEQFTTWMVMVAKTERNESKMKKEDERKEHESNVEAKLRRLEQALDEFYDMVAEFREEVEMDVDLINRYLKQFAISDEIKSYKDLIDHAMEWGRQEILREMKKQRGDD